MKLTTMFLIMVALQFSIFMFSEGTTTYASSELTTVVLNPTDWGNWHTNPFFILLAVGIGLVGIAAAAGFITGFKTDTMLFSSLILIIVGWATPIVSLYQVIAKETLFGTQEVVFQGISMTANQLIASMVSAPLILLGAFSIWGWWRSNSEM